MVLEWTEQHVQDLIRIPDRLFEDSVWQRHIQNLGGLATLYEHLRTSPLKPHEHALLDAMLTNPGAPVQTYCDLLHIHQATFHRYQRRLFQRLTIFLNSESLTIERLAASIESTIAPIFAHQLRSPIADFSGRTQEKAQLLSQTQQQLDQQHTALLVGIHGMGGIGKTELAIWLAHQVMGFFPDAQIFLNLQSMHQSSVSLTRALHQIIQVFVKTDQIPTNLEQLQQLYHSVLHQKRVLILLDNALDANQVRPLIPPTGSGLIITSRQRFSLPGMIQMQLEALTSKAAQTFLGLSCPRLKLTEQARLAEACCNLPLALRTSASILTNNPALSITNYLQQLADTRHRLSALVDPDDSQLDVASSLELSYASLEQTSQLLLHGLAILGGDFSLALVKPILSTLIGAGEIEPQLYGLLRRSLLQYDNTRERWYLHDLIRSLVLSKLTSTQTKQLYWAYCEIIGQFVHELQLAYLQGGESTLASLRRFDQERQHIESVWDWIVQQEPEPDFDQWIVNFMFNTQKISRLRTDRVVRYQQLEYGLKAAQRLANPEHEGQFLWYLGAIASHRGKLDQAKQLYQQAIEQIKLVDAENKLTQVQFDLGGIYFTLGGKTNIQTALTIWIECLAAYRRLNVAPNLIALSLNNIGAAYRSLGDFDQCLAYFAQALTVAQACQDYIESCRILFNIGAIHQSKAEYQAARERYNEALILAEEIGSQEGIGMIASRLAQIKEQLGDYVCATDLFSKALAIFQAAYDREQEAYTAWFYGLMQLRRGQRQAGLDLLRQAFGYAQSIGHEAVERHAAFLAKLEAGEPFSEDLVPAYN